MFKLPTHYSSLSQKEKKQVREQYIKQQKNLCYFCSSELDKEPAHSIKFLYINRALFPKGFFNNPVHLHHSHKTGLTIGSVHAECNAVLWQYYGE